MYKQKRIQLFSVRKGKRNHRLVTGTERDKEKIFIIMRVFSPLHHLMIFPDNWCNKYYIPLYLEKDAIGRSPFLCGALYYVYEAESTVFIPVRICHLLPRGT